MKIKNYTSNIPVERTVSRIEQVLAESGAQRLVKDYGPDRQLSAIEFMSQLPNGTSVTIRLPVNPEGVYRSLSRQVKRPRSGTKDRLKEQAARTAWKLLQDWVEVQVSLIQMEQAEFLQVFMPYVTNGRTTFFEAIKSAGYTMLPGVGESGK